MTGVFLSNVRGFGFVRVEGRDEDLFIPQGLTHGALYSDTVEVKLLPYGSGAGKRQEAEVTRIIARGITQVVGTYQKKKKFGIIIPDNQKIPFAIHVKSSDSMGAVTSHKVVADMIDYGNAQRSPSARITEILGHKDDPGVDVLSIVRAYDLPVEFPQEVTKELGRIPDEPDIKSVKNLVKMPASGKLDDIPPGRLDLRKVTTVTIDGEDAKDLDDAISLSYKNSIWRLGVHIADVSNYVQKGTALDKEALNRGTSVYLADRVIPMLPRKLSNGVCSLNNGENRLALSCLMDIDEGGHVVAYKITESLICSDARLSYHGVMRLFEDKDESEIVEKLTERGVRGIKTNTLKIARMLRKMRKLAAILKKNRIERGAVDFDIPESKILLDDMGHPTGIEPYERTEANDMIEDFMLLANATVAEHCYWLDLPFIYRTHARPDKDKLRQLVTFARALGIRFKPQQGDVHPSDIQNLLASLKGMPQEDMMRRMALRSMSKAEYTTYCEGHFGLALHYYCHFTSPIRRYPDLQIHRIIKESLHGTMNEERSQQLQQILPDIAKRCSQTEQRSVNAERDTDRLKKAEYMEDHLGESFDGTISGVTGWGLYVELPDTVEGLVHISTLADDYYLYDEKRMCLVGEHTGREYHLGDPVRVKAVGADTVARTVDFLLVSRPDSKKKRHEKQNKEKKRPKSKKKTGKN